jgi:hypothetical protein
MSGNPLRPKAFILFNFDIDKSRESFRITQDLGSGSGTFLQRGSPPPPPWRLLPELFFLRLDVDEAGKIH